VSRAAQQRFRGPLAAVIGRLALSPGQIEELPNNYAAAVASGEFANDYNPQQPDRPFLPDNLFATDGPWVCVGRPDGPVAPEHLGDNNLFTNSAFLVFLRLPGGRPATLDYLKRLRSFNQPPRVRPDDATRNAGYTSIPNPQLPKFSAGTQVALVRRALLVTSPPRVVPTALTESVQLRVYLKIPDLTLQTLNDAAGLDRDSNHRVRSLQFFHEFRLSRALLFAGRAGGLHAVGSHERDFKTGFRAHMDDDLEIPVTVDSRSIDARQDRIKETCIGCHNLPGVYSFNSYFSYVQGDYRGADTGRHAALSENPPAHVLGSTAQWKQTRPDWAALRTLLAE
jgi:hypothetical protein